MSKGAFWVLAAQFAPRIIQVNRSTWLAVVFGFISLIVLSVWALFALIGWLWDQGKTLAEGAPEATRAVVTQVEQALPGAREKLSEVLPALKAEPLPRDVSGSDIGPVQRFPDLVRSFWKTSVEETAVSYEGRADYVSVLNHYIKGFIAQGYLQNVVSATATAEVHDYRKGTERIRFEITQLPQGKVKATIIDTVP